MQYLRSVIVSDQIDGELSGVVERPCTAYGGLQPLAISSVRWEGHRSVYFTVYVRTPSPRGVQNDYGRIAQGVRIHRQGCSILYGIGEHHSSIASTNTCR
jgi:hypothetical protein